MIKDFVKKDLNRLSYNLKEDLKAFVTPFKVVPKDILDYFFMVFKIIVIVTSIVTVIGIVQRPGKDANVDYVLQANHEQMLEETANTAR